MKKVIVHLVNSNIYSGLEKIACEIIQNLNKEYEFVYVCRDGIIIDYLKSMNIKYYLIKKMSIKEIKKMINKLKPNIIHTHDYRASCITSLTRTNIPIISHLHNNPSWIKTINPYSIMYLLASFRFKKIIIVSNQIKDEYIFKKNINKKTYLLVNFINIDKLNKNLGDEKYKKEYDICSVARLTKQKNPEKFIKIIFELKKEYPDIKAIWIGDGNLFDKCQKLVKKLKLENNIEFLGYQENPYKYMKKSKIFLLTSRSEGQPLSIIEALTLGIPCVVANVGGVSNLIDLSCGFLCNNKKDFIYGIKTSLNDKNKYKLYQEKSLEKSKQINNLNNYMKKMEKVYEEY